MTRTTTTTTALPLHAGVWTLDRPHCSVEFTARHMAISKVRGRFHAFDAHVVVGGTLEESSLRAVVDLASVDTDDPDRDAHLRGSDFFSADRHPEMVFESTAITATGPATYAVVGDLTINGTTRSEVLTVTFNGLETFPGDGTRHAGFEATATIDRRAYGVDFNVPLRAGGFVISDRIRIELDVQLLAPEA